VQGPHAPGPVARDWRIDVLRGMAIVFVVVNHLRLTSPLGHATSGSIGFVSGAELFVILSGFVLGMVHHRRVQMAGWLSSAQQLLRRAWTLYVASVVAAVLVLVLSWVPGVQAEAAMFNPFRRGTPDLYANSGVADLVFGILTLRYGPWQINILGLYVVLLLFTPLLTAILRRSGGWACLLGASVAVWVAFSVGIGGRLFTQGDDSFPVLAWQMLFVIGLVAGWHRARIAAAARTSAGRVGAGLFVVAACGFSVYRRLVADDAPGFDRETLEIGRVVNVVVVVPALYVALGAIRWMQRPARWALEDLGRSTLYVFLVHLFLAIGVATLLGGSVDASAPVAFALQVGVLAAVWLMVRHRVLFSVIPR
jgi:hypothetical protein